MQHLFFIIIIIGLLCNSNFVQAHAEKGKPRFVANSGVDQGKCGNRFRPCKTIAYAVSQAHKGDKILVAKGSYETGLAYLISELVPVYGGYNQLDNFQLQSPDINATFLTGVPAQYAQQLSQKGFNIIQDSLRQPSPELKAQLQTLASLQITKGAQACTNGKSGQFSCNNISLKSHLPISAFSGQSSANDIWGHVDLNTGKEYAILGLRSGTAVVNLENPSQPVVVGIISGQSSSWRDIKVYQHYDNSSLSWKAYAYVTTDNVSNEGVTIIDLSQLAQNKVSLVKKQKIHNSAHNLYISGVDYSLGIASEAEQPLVHIAGASRNGGALQSYDLSDPRNLTSAFDAAGSVRSDYTHDAASLYIDDARKSQCSNATSQGCLVILDFNEQEIHLWDQSVADKRQRLSSATYPQASYVHSGWWSEDKNYMFVHDELDEQNFNVNTTVQIFDITSLTSPKLVKTWRGPTAAIDHNGFVRGNRYYMSNYERGLTILDISNPVDPKEIGFFDTYPSSDNNAFNGAWGAYPYLPSGLILVSDINSGLYVLEDHTRNQTYNTLGFKVKSQTGKEGESIQVVVSRSGKTDLAVEVAYQTLPGSASQSDFTATSGKLSWAANDTADKTVTIAINADQLDQEITERFFLRLHQPSAGAVLSTNNLLWLDIEGRANTGVLAFNQDTTTVRENQGKVEINVSRTGGSSDATSVNWTLEGQSARLNEDVESASGTLTWASGDTSDKSIELTLINDQSSESTEVFQVKLSANGNALLGQQSTLSVVIRDDESNKAPVANAGEDRQVNTRQTVELKGQASDAENATLKFEWKQVSGPSVALTAANELTSRFSAPAEAATLVFSLTATDDFGAAHSDNVSISVQAPATTPAPTPPPTTTPAPTTPTPAPAPTPASSGSGGGSVPVWAIMMISALLLRRRTMLTTATPGV